ncbi:MAG: type II toxin-antitoxin system VapC family toxin [Bacteroidia bacterium]|nr:type II toxin-antitoxin system VapC family toxin [Bacteroidia bacterium]
MSGYILDTHVLLWMISGDKRLSEKARVLIGDTDNKMWFSIASYWEICIKIRLGKLALHENWRSIIKSEMVAGEISILTISEEHCHETMNLPLWHRDPFDRIILAQASVERSAVISADSKFSQYKNITVCW